MPLKTVKSLSSSGTLGAGMTTDMSTSQYPFQFQRDIVFKNSTMVHVRPVRPEDEDALKHFFEELSEETVFLRFGQRRINISHDHLLKLCKVDYERDLPFLAIIAGNEKRIIGEARLNRLRDCEMAELSFVISDQWQGMGIGNLLMEFCIWVAKEAGFKTLVMEVMSRNERMKQFGFKYGFHPLPGKSHDGFVELDLKIDEVSERGTRRKQKKAKYAVFNSQASPTTTNMQFF